MADKKKLKTFILKNKVGAFAKITNLGGIIMELQVPTKDGSLRNVVLGHEHPEDYLSNPHYIGAIVGRYANRIANSKFELEGQSFQLTQNHGSCILHGGINGFDKKIWNVTSVSKSHIVFQTISEHGEEGFPGRLDIRVKYMFDNDNQLLINYRATTDKATVINLTNHSYFNLDGESSNSILNHSLQIDANHILPYDHNCIPLSSKLEVIGTPFDFRSARMIKDGIDNDHDQIKLGSGYDHNFIINNHTGKIQKIATAESSDNQISMDVLTTEPGVQLYTGNSLSMVKKDGRLYPRRSAFCLETQHFPDSPNRSDFPSVVLRQEGVYLSQTVYKFN